MIAKELPKSPHHIGCLLKQNASLDIIVGNILRRDNLNSATRKIYNTLNLKHIYLNVSVFLNYKPSVKNIFLVDMQHMQVQS